MPHPADVITGWDPSLGPRSRWTPLDGRWLPQDLEAGSSIANIEAKRKLLRDKLVEAGVEVL